MIRLFIVLVLHWQSALAFELRVEFAELDSEKGSLRYLLFNHEAGFPDDAKKSLRQGSLPAQEAKEGLLLKALEPGEYALAVIHDENDNAQLDTNFLGMPKEKFGFSNNPKIYFGPPDFEDSAFSLTENKSITVRMKDL